MTQYAYQDIDIEFNRQRDGDIKLLSDVDAVKASIMNIVRTMEGSRRMLPDFAYGVVHLLHEQMSRDTAQRIGESIYDALTSWEDRIDITNIDVNVNYERAVYNITMTYNLKSIGSLGETLTLNFILKRL